MRLSTLLTPQQRASWLLWDNPYDLARSLGLNLAEPTDQQRLQRLISFVLKVLSPHASGVFADASVVLPVLSAKAKKTGTALRWDKTTEAADPLTLPMAESEWDIEAIRNNYAVATLSLWYHPDEAAALLKKQLVAELADSCRYEGIDLVLQLQWYQPPLSGENEASNELESVIQAIQELRTLPQAMLLEPFADPLTAATATTELDIPWVVTLTGPDYVTVKDQLRASLDSGAVGFAIGGALWGDVSQHVDLTQEQAVLEWLAKEARDRLIELRRIVDEQAMSVV